MKDRAIVALLHCFAHLPLSFARWLGAGIGRLLWWGNGRSRKVTEQNLRLCLPQLNELERDQLARASLAEIGKTVMEMGATWLQPPARSLALVQKVQGKAAMDAAAATGKGVILLAPHHGNWEILGLYLGRHYTTTSLYQPPKSPALDQLIHRAREQSGANLVPTNRRGVAALLKALQRGELIGVLPDQEPEPESGCFAPFFNVNALTMTLVSNLARKTGARVFCGYAKRSADGYEIVFLPANEDIYQEDLPVSVTALNASVEQCVKDSPAQYQWEYKRFRERPDGESRFY